MRAIRTLLTLVAALVSCLAQAPTAQVTGRVTDSSTGVVPNAGIEVNNIDTGVNWAAATNGDGYYTVPLLPPGNYHLAVRAQGFKELARSLRLEVGQVARVDFTLEVGAVSETVEVTGAPPLLESSTASIGQVVQMELVSQMPLNGRNYLNLAKGAMGIAEPSGIGQAGTAGDRAKNGGSFVANGVRADMNNFILDGVDNNAKIVDLSSNSNVVIQPSIDAIQDFKVETNNYSAEYGYSAGAIVNATIRSGTNQFHGRAFEFLRNSRLDARDFFLQPSAAKPILQRNQYGGVFGGPVKRNKTFFFASWEGTRQNQGTTIVTTVPSDALKSGNFAGQKTIFDPASLAPNPNGSGFIRTVFAGNIVPANRFTTPSAKITALIPEANAPGVANNFVSSPVQNLKRNEYDFRGDQNFSDKDKLFLRYSYYTYNFVNPGPFAAPLIGTTNFQQSTNNQTGHEAAAGATHVFGSGLVNEVRTGYNRISNALAPFVHDNLFQQFGFVNYPQQPGVTGLPNITVSGYTNLGEAGFLPDAKGSDTYILADNVLWNKGKHFLKLGGQYRWVRSRFNIAGAARGSFGFNGVFTNNPQSPSNSGNAFADFLLGIPNSSTLANIFIGDLRYKYYGAFLNDDWKLTPKLTLNLGVRYEIWTPPLERHDQQGNFILGPNKLIYPGNKVPSVIPASFTEPIPDGVDSRGLLEFHKNNWSPRLGLAWQVAQHTVIRAGAGMFYGEPDALGASGRPVAEPPFRINNVYSTDSVHSNVTFQSGFPAGALNVTSIDPNSATFIAFTPDLKPGYVYHWSLGVQQQVGRFVLDANYVGTKGTHLSVNYNYNQDVAGGTSVAARRPVQGFGDIQYMTSMGNSIYNALEMHLERRFSNGMSVISSYTYSKSIDLSSGGLSADLQLRNARTVGWERALSSSDMRHRFVASYLYELPFGHGKHFDISNTVLNGVLGNWQVNGITTVRTGQPFTPQLGFSSANTGDSRPNRLANGNLPPDRRTPDHWFDVAAFAAAPNYQYGNAGRDIIEGPGAINFDFSLFKRFRVRKLGEAGEIQFRGELFNIFNHPQFGQPNARVDLPQGGSITFLTNSMRQIQFGLKVLF
jgi:hypothetical protein